MLKNTPGSAKLASKAIPCSLTSVLAELLTTTSETASKIIRLGKRELAAANNCTSLESDTVLHRSTSTPGPVSSHRWIAL